MKRGSFKSHKQQDSSAVEDNLSDFMPGISPSHSVDSGFDDNGTCYDMSLFLSLEKEIADFDELNTLLLDDDFIPHPFREGNAGDLIEGEQSTLLPEINSDWPLPTKVGSSGSRNLSVELDHCYNLPKPLGREMPRVEEPDKVLSEEIDVVSQSVDGALEVTRDSRNDTTSEDHLPDHTTLKPKNIIPLSPEAYKRISKRKFDDDVETVDKSKRNAENARLNRQRKKRYVENLEKEIRHLRSTNSALIGERKGLKNQVKELQGQVECLKGIIENDTTLSSVLKAVVSVPGLKFNKKSISNSVVSPVPACKRTKQSDNKTSSVDEAKKAKTGSGGGICLHVKNDVVSLAMCGFCSDSAGL